MQYYTGKIPGIRVFYLLVPMDMIRMVDISLVLMNEHVAYTVKKEMDLIPTLCFFNIN